MSLKKSSEGKMQTTGRVLSYVVPLLALVILGYALMRVVELEERVAGNQPAPPQRAPQRTPHKAARTGPVPGRRAAPGGDVRAVEKRLEQMAGKLDAALGRLDALEKAGTQGAWNAGGAASSPLPSRLDSLQRDMAALKKEVDALKSKLETARSSIALDNEKARAGVTSMVQEELDKLRQERRERRRAVRDMVADELVNQFAAKSNMTDAQVAKLYPSLMELRESFSQSWRAVRRGEMDFAEARETIIAARKKMDANARAVLNDEQYRLYEEETEERFGGPAGLFK